MGKPVVWLIMQRAARFLRTHLAHVGALNLAAVMPVEAAIARRVIEVPPVPIPKPLIISYHRALLLALQLSHPLKSRPRKFWENCRL